MAALGALVGFFALIGFLGGAGRDLVTLEREMEGEGGELIVML